jgi:enoyl-CoA hydratase/carnithine racemase
MSARTLDEYADRYARNFALSRDQAGVLEIRMHTGGGPALFSRELLMAWGEVLRDAGADPGNEVILLTGTGDAWIAGVDPASFATPPGQWSAAEVYAQFRAGVRLLEALVADVEVPTIGVINGPGPRQEVALACDLTLCADTTRIGDGNVAAGSVPGDGMYLVLAELIGAKRAAGLALTGATLSAAEALDLGLVNEVVPAASLAARARELAATIVTRPPVARRLTHAVLTRGWQRRVLTDLREQYAVQLLQAVTAAR